MRGADCGSVIISHGWDVPRGRGNRFRAADVPGATDATMGPAMRSMLGMRLCVGVGGAESSSSGIMLGLDVVGGGWLRLSKAAGADQGGSAAGTTRLMRRGCGGIARGLVVDAGYALFQLTDTIVCLVQCGGIRTRAAWRARMEAAGVGTIMLLTLVTRPFTIAADLRGDVASRTEEEKDNELACTMDSGQEGQRRSSRRTLRRRQKSQAVETAGWRRWVVRVSSALLVAGMAVRTRHDAYVASTREPSVRHDYGVMRIRQEMVEGGRGPTTPDSAALSVGGARSGGRGGAEGWGKEGRRRVEKWSMARRTG